MKAGVPFDMDELTAQLEKKFKEETSEAEVDDEASTPDAGDDETSVRGESGIFHCSQAPPLCEVHNVYYVIPWRGLQGGGLCVRNGNVGAGAISTIESRLNSQDRKLTTISKLLGDISKKLDKR